MGFEFAFEDVFIILLLIFLEGILSVDNALVLAILARSLPEKQQTRALTYGLVGAIAFRILALFMAGFLMKWTWTKFAGGGYLVYVALAHWLSKPAKDGDGTKKIPVRTFWKTVIVIELTDVAFAVDSILTAVAVSDKLWVVVTGGIIGLVMMRFAATYFISLLKKYPQFENTAYLLIFGVGIKLLIDGFKFKGVNFHDVKNPAFWAFWVFVIVSVALGFRKGDRRRIVQIEKTLAKEKKAVEKIESGL